jgi:hypothetical protein
MKSIFLTLSVFISINAFAAINPVGKFQSKHQVLAQMYTSKAECVADNGHWLKSDEMCLFDTSDDAVVTKEGENFKLTVTTITSNLHMCEFSAPAVLVGNILVSEVSVDEYNSENGETTPETCIVSAELSNNGKTMSITTNQKCQSFCGANASLEVDLKKVK